MGELMTYAHSCEIENCIRYASFYFCGNVLYFRLGVIPDMPNIILGNFSKSEIEQQVIIALNNEEKLPVEYLKERGAFKFSLEMLKNECVVIDAPNINTLNGFHFQATRPSKKEHIALQVLEPLGACLSRLNEEGLLGWIHNDPSLLWSLICDYSKPSDWESMDVAKHN